MKRPEVPTNLACAWCKGAGIEPVGDCYWTDNANEGGDGVGRWMQVYKHPGCNEDRQWTYQIAWLPDPRKLDSGAESK